MRKPSTGEPYAGKPPVRFGGRGGAKAFPTPIRLRRRGEATIIPYRVRPSQHLSSPRKLGSSRGDATKRRRKLGSRREWRKSGKPCSVVSDARVREHDTCL